MTDAPKLPPHHELLDRTFHISLLIKGADGLLEMLGGLFLLVVPPALIGHLVDIWTRNELSQDPHDFIATHLLHTAQGLSSTHIFGAIYLLAHGFIKIFLVAALLKNRLWAYPLSLAVLFLFILYQVYDIGLRHSVFMILLTLFDLFVIWLIWREWKVREGIMTKKENHA